MTRFNRPFLGLALLLALNSCSEFSPSKTADSQELTEYYQLNGPDFSQSGFDSTQFILTNFAGPDLVPSPSCLSVAATGEVFVGVDMIGSLGKEPGKGKIVRLIDQDKDGVMDSHTVFAQVDNPRGIIAMGEKVYVLHTVFGTDSIASNMDLVVFEDKNADGIADSTFTRIGQFSAIQLRTTLNNLTNYKGCYYITAVDRSGNESPRSNTVCS